MFKKKTVEPEPRRPAVWNTLPVDGVKKIILVGSGKGGVGKSTTAVNLARALARQGKRVGLLDADIYGPSLPRMLGLANNAQPDMQEGRMLPFIADTMPCMSIEFVTGGKAAVLRGPMITKSLVQLLRGTKWDISGEPLDMLLVDLPPGTGDVPLSLAQNAPISGAIVVTTPQAVAADDARKAISMFEKLNIPLLGVVENMSGGLFGSGGGERLAKETHVPFLGAVTLDAEISEAGDSGRVYLPEAYKEIAGRLA